jgi:adenylate cyclase
VSSVWGELKRRNVVRVAIAYAIVSWLVLQLTDVLVPMLGMPDWVGGFVFLMLVVGFLIALVLSWAYEMTPEGVKLEKNVDRSKSITKGTGRKLDFTIIGVLSIALLMMAWDKFAAPPIDTPEGFVELPDTVVSEPTFSAEVNSAQTTAANSIAVLPFVNMSSDKEQEYFSDGLSEELLNLLARIPELRVTSRSSAFFYKGKEIKISEVGRELGVGHILEGSVRRSGETIRVTAQLIDVHTDAHIWSETWDREFTDIFVIQDDIAAAVVDALKINLLGEAPKVVETSPEVYALYLQGKYLYAQRSADSARRAATLVERALEMDKEFVPAWILFGEIYRAGSAYGAWEPHEGYRLALDAATEALRLDEKNAQAHLILSQVASNYEYDLETAIEEIDIALALAPGDIRIRSRTAFLHMLAGDVSTYSTELLQQAARDDPTNLQLRMSIGYNHLYSGRPEEAIEVFNESVTLNPNIDGAHFRLGQALIVTTQYDAALEAINKETRDGFQHAGRALLYQAIGNRERSQSELEQLIALGNVWTYEIAMVFAYRGDLDEAFTWLDRAFERRDQSLNAVIVDPFMTRLYDDPRFDLLVERKGLTKAWELRKSQL